MVGARRGTARGDGHPGSTRDDDHPPLKRSPSEYRGAPAGYNHKVVNDLKGIMIPNTVPHPILVTLCERGSMFMWRSVNHIQLRPLLVDAFVPPTIKDLDTTQTKQAAAIVLPVASTDVTNVFLLIEDKHSGALNVCYRVFNPEDMSVTWTYLPLLTANETDGPFHFTLSLLSMDTQNETFTYRVSCLLDSGDNFVTYRLNVRKHPGSAHEPWTFVLTKSTVGQCQNDPLVHSTKPRGCNTVRPENVEIVTATASNKVCLWGTRGSPGPHGEHRYAEALHEFDLDLPHPDDNVIGLSTSQSGRIAVLSARGVVQVWEAESNNPNYTLEKQVYFVDQQDQHAANPDVLGQFYPTEVSLCSFGARCEVLAVNFVQDIPGKPSWKNRHISVYVMENENQLTVSGGWTEICRSLPTTRKYSHLTNCRTICWTRQGGIITGSADMMEVYSGWTRHPQQADLTQELQFLRAKRNRFHKRKGTDVEQLSLHSFDTQIEANGAFGAMAALKQSPLPDYHPTFLVECLHAGLVDQVRASLGHLYRCIIDHTEAMKEELHEVDIFMIPREKMRINPPPVPLKSILIKRELGIKLFVRANTKNQAPKRGKDTAASLFAMYDDDDDDDGGFAQHTPTPAAQSTRGAAAALFSFGGESDDEDSTTDPPIAPTTTSMSDLLACSEADMFEKLSELLPIMQLGELSPSENLKLLAVVSVFDALHGSSGNAASAHALDRYGAQFMLVHKEFQVKKRCMLPAQRPRNMLTADVMWAYHSDSQDALVDQCFASECTWEYVRSLGTGLWLKSPLTARKLAEKIAQAEYRASKDKDPFSCALYYFALGKKQVVMGLFRLVKNTRVATLLSNDFSQEKWKRAAIKNAFALLQKHRYKDAACFFILGGSVKDAVNICVKNLKDYQLALFIALVVNLEPPASPSDEQPTSTEMRESVVEDMVLPLAFHARDPWLASLAFSMLGNVKQSITVFSAFDDALPLARSRTDELIQHMIGSSSPKLSQQFNPSEPLFIMNRLSHPQFSDSDDDAIEQEMACVLKSSLLRATSFLMNSGLPLLALKQLDDLWELNLPDHIPEGERPTTVWRDSLRRDLAAEASEPVLLHVRSKLLMRKRVPNSGPGGGAPGGVVEPTTKKDATTEALSGTAGEIPPTTAGETPPSDACPEPQSTPHPITPPQPNDAEIERLKANLADIESFCELPRTHLVVNSLMHLCTRAKLEAVKLMLLHPSILESPWRFMQEIGRIVSEMSEIAETMGLERMNGGLEGGLPPSRRCAALVVVVVDAVQVLLPAAPASPRNPPPNCDDLVPLWAASSICTYFTLLVSAIQMDQVGLIRSLVDFSFPVDRFAILTNELRHAALRLSFDWFDHEEMLIQRRFSIPVDLDDDPPTSGSDRLHPGMKAWAEIYCRRLMKLLIVRECVQKMFKFCCSILGDGFLESDKLATDSLYDEQFFVHFFESANRWCEVLLCDLHSCNPPLSLNVKALGPPARKMSSLSALDSSLSPINGGCAFLKPLYKLMYDAFDNNDEQYLWQTVNGCGYLRLLFAEVGSKDHDVLQRHPETVAEFNLDQTTELYHKPGQLILGCVSVPAEPDYVQVASEHGIREINIVSSIVFRQRSPSRRTLLDEECSSWEASFKRFQHFETIHGDHGIHFFETTHNRNPSPNDNNAKSRVMAGQEQSELAIAIETWQSHDAWVNRALRGARRRRAGSFVQNPLGVEFQDNFVKRYLSLDQRRQMRAFRKFSGPHGTQLSHNSSTLKLAAHPFLPNYFSGHMDGSLVLWEVGCPNALCKYEKPGKSGWKSGYITRVRTSMEGSKVASCDSAGQLAIWQTCGGKSTVLPCVGLKCNDKRTLDCEFLNSGSIIATVGHSVNEKNLSIWDTRLPPRACRVAAVASGGHGNGLYSMAHSERYQQIVLGGAAGQVLVYDMRQRKVSDEVVHAHSKSIMAIRWDPSGSYFGTGSTDGSVKIWSLGSSRLEQVGHLPGIHPMHTFVNQATSGSMISQRGVTDLFFTTRALISCGADGAVKMTPKGAFLV